MTYQDTSARRSTHHEAIRSYGFCLTGAGLRSINPVECDPPSGRSGQEEPDWQRGQKLPDFHLVLISGGTGEFESEVTGIVRVEGASLALLRPGVWHRFQPDPIVNWSVRWLSFNGELVRRLFDSGMLLPSSAVSESRNTERLIGEFDELLSDINQRSQMHPAVLTCKSLRFISSAMEECIEDRVGPDAASIREFAYSSIDDPIVRHALDLIWSDSHKPMSVSDIARQLPVTRRTLDRRFAEATGRTVLEEINFCRLSRAKRLLLETDLPVKTIARQAGFSSTERMRVAFVEREGTSPTVFRKRTTQADNLSGRSGVTDVNTSSMAPRSRGGGTADPLS